MEKTKLEQKIDKIRNKQNLDNELSNLKRARSIHVGTVFGGTSEILMRGDGDKFLYAILQPVEVVELIHQLSANVGCDVSLKPRKDFSSWRDWRVSEAEKKHLNGFPPFVNDMALFHSLGASGFNDEETKKIMDSIANAKEYVNEYDTSKISGIESDEFGCPNVMIGEEDGLIHNKLLLDENKQVVYMAGGSGGGTRSENFQTKRKNQKSKKV